MASQPAGRRRGLVPLTEVQLVGGEILSNREHRHYATTLGVFGEGAEGWMSYLVPWHQVVRVYAFDRAELADLLAPAAGDG